MDNRESMASYFMHNRGLGATPNPQLIHGGQQQQQQQQSIRSITNPNPNLGSRMNNQFEPSHLMNVCSNNSSSNSSGQVGEQQVKRKRGRPRKYGPDGSAALTLSPLSVMPLTSGSGDGSMAVGPGGTKRGRGRPPGTGRKQQLASLGELFVGSAGMGFTPHVIRIAEGEDIAAKMLSFSQQGPRVISILSAHGAVSTATLCQPENPTETVTYEGRFEILGLCGSCLQTEDGRSGGLTVTLSSPNGRVIGGVVGGLLRAATPVQVVVGSFLYGGSKTKNKSNKTDQDSSSHEHELPMSDDQSTPLGSMMDGWPGSRQMDMRNALDIDLAHG